MLRKMYKVITLTAMLAVIGSSISRALDVDEYDPDYFDRLKIDRYLDVEIWTNHSDNEFYEGDHVVLNFRSNRDAFVAIYSIDSRGHVNLLFPTSPGADNFITGGATYTLPGGSDDFDLVISGPEGVENIQIIASRERFPVPDWYPVSGLVCDWNDRLEYMDHLNGRYFVRYDGQRFAFDRTAIYIYEWEPDYFRPVYYPHYPSWSVCSNIYVDYPWGATVYINGVYWGITPLYIPRIYVGWHTFTIYDYYGYCWEYPVHVTRYHTVVLDRSIVVLSPTVVSKYKEVRLAGYRSPIDNGYPNFKTKAVRSAQPSVGKGQATAASETKDLSKRYVRGSAKVVKGDRGYETVAVKPVSAAKGKSVDEGRSSSSYEARGSKSSASEGKKSSGSSSARYKSSSRGPAATKSSGSSKATSKGSGSDESSSYYQKKSGASSYKKPSKSTTTKRGQGSSVESSKPKSAPAPSKQPSPAPKSSKSSDNKSSSTDNRQSPDKKSKDTNERKR
jgi:hypothetical protein